MPKVYLLDYVAGNIRSLANAIEKVGYTVEWIRSPEDVERADVSAQLAKELLLFFPNDMRLHFKSNRMLETKVAITETHTSWCWPFRTLHDSVLLRRLSPRDSKTY